MHETTFSHSNLEAPAPGATLPAGRHLLLGWVWPKPGGHFVDVRARVGDRLFPGIHGRPRADLAAHFQTGRSRALAGFTVAVELTAGPAEVVLEVLELEGRWSAFQTVPFTITSGTVTPAPAFEPLRWHDYCRGLDLLLRSRRTRLNESWTGLAEELVSELPVPQDLLVPPEPFIGHADEPVLVNSSKFGRLPVVGYLFHTTEKLTHLWASADLQALQPLTLGRATENLLPHFPQYPAAGVSGYEGYVDVPAQLPNPITLRLYAEAPDGALQLVQVRRTRRHDAELEKYPYAGANAATFAAAETAWRSALQAHGLHLREDAEFGPAVEKLRNGYLATLPAPAPRPQAVSVSATPASAIRPPARITLASHNLNLEGAPLFLLDLAQHLAAGGAVLTVLSASDGVLRERYAACGARVVIVDPGPVFRARSATEARDALASLGRTADFGAADLVIGSTFTTFWA
ncbi:MAG: hypothetical protein ACHQ5A_06880, partial [Opitutales bacterium]